MGVTISSPTTNVDNSTITYNASNQIQVGSGSVTPDLFSTEIKERILITESTLTGAASSIELTGLTTTEYDMLQIVVLYSKVGSTNNSYLVLEINNDTTQTNYTVGITLSGVSAQYANGYAGFVCNQMTDEKLGSCVINLTNYTSRRHTVSFYGGDESNVAFGTGINKANTDQITQLKIKDNNGYNMAIGTKVILYGIK